LIHEDLAVAAGAGADADDGDRDGRGHLRAERGGDGLEDDGEGAASATARASATSCRAGFVAAALHAMAEDLDALGREADMAADGTTVLDERRESWARGIRRLRS
jgi:hypothetical protein